MRAALKRQNDRFDELYREAEKAGTTPEQLEAIANIVLDKERRAAAGMRSRLEPLEQNVIRKRPITEFTRSLKRTDEEMLEIVHTWLELYQNVRIRLLKLASDRRAAAGETGSPISSDAGEIEAYLRRIAEG